MRRFAYAMLVVLGFLMPAAATILSSANKIIVPGNGVQTVFSFPFVGVAVSDITVTYTDALGNQTVLAQGPGSTQYQVALNSAGSSLWGVGGTVTYNPSGTPIASGTTLTILRALPFQQTVSLQNQASFGQYATATEQAIDQLAMQIQQLNEAIGRGFTANVANSAPPVQLPPAAQVASLGACFDASGLDLIACSLAPAGIISSAMAPVVGAASLAAGRTAFGLGSFATEAINSGTCGGPSLQDDGTGNARVVPTTVQDSTNQNVTCNFHLNQRMATGPITYTLGKASSTYFNGFQTTINALAGIITVLPNAADNFAGVASGTAITIPAGSICRITTNAASTATWWLDCNISQASLSVAVTGGTGLVLALYATALPFRDTTLATGDSNWALPASGITIIIPTNATLGTTNSTPFRVWIFVAYNSGMPVLGVATCSSPTAIYGCKAWETIRKSGTAISGTATALGTLYTNGTITNDAVRIIGYADYASGLAAAGQWTSTPTTLQLCIPPFTCPRPGDVIQTVRTFAGTVATGSTALPADNTIPQVTEGDSYMTQAIVPTSTPNLLEIEAQGVFAEATSTSRFGFALFRDATANALAAQLTTPGAAGAQFLARISYVTLATSIASTTFSLRAGNAAGNTATFNGDASTQYYGGVMNSYIKVWEIMGALERPANDNNQLLRMVG